MSLNSPFLGFPKFRPNSFYRKPFQNHDINKKSSSLHGGQSRPTSQREINQRKRRFFLYNKRKWDDKGVVPYG